MIAVSDYQATHKAIRALSELQATRLRHRRYWIGLRSEADALLSELEELNVSGTKLSESYMRKSIRARCRKLAETLDVEYGSAAWAPTTVKIALDLVHSCLAQILQVRRQQIGWHPVPDEQEEVWGEE